LKPFPTDKLWIDQSFVRDIANDQADMEVANAVIALALILRIESLAEGIETEAQLEFLESARPMSVDDLARFAGEQAAA
jgi:EAL domain-containing protein (putative c-di-GMP-specific phosphodiesterase class I)